MALQSCMSHLAAATGADASSPSAFIGNCGAYVQAVAAAGSTLPKLGRSLHHCQTGRVVVRLLRGEVALRNHSTNDARTLAMALIDAMVAADASKAAGQLSEAGAFPQLVQQLPLDANHPTAAAAEG